MVGLPSVVAPVGALVEEITPRRIVLPRDALCLAVLLATSVLIHLWLVSHTHTTARDGIRFARTALNLERSFAETVKDAKACPDPPGFPLAVLGISKVVRLVDTRSLPEQMLLSAQIASSLAAVLLVLPTYWLGRMLFHSEFAGFAGALLFQVVPTVAQITSDGLSDSSSLLCIVTALVCAVRAIRTQSTKWFLFAGLASGCGYLVRPEGLIAAPALIGVALCLRWSWSAKLGRTSATFAGLILVATPYMLIIGGISNKPSVNEPLKKLIPARLMVNNGTSNVLIAEWYSGQGSQVVWAFTAIAKETAKASHYAAFGLGIVALILLRRRLDRAFAVVLLAGLLQICLLLALAMKPMPDGSNPEAVPPYVSERHTLLLAYFACLFTGGLLTITPRFGMLLFLALLASALPGALKPLHENRAGHLHAGRFLDGKIGKHDAVIDPFEWAHWYSGHALLGVEPDPDDKDLETRWVVWEPTAGTKQNPHSRLPRLATARNVVEDGANPPQLVYHWPESVPPEQAKVVVYKQSVKR